jgi:large subunit ribosomal protein L25
MFRVHAKTRGTSKGSRTAVRRLGYIPAVLYGKDLAPLPVMVSADELAEALRKGARHRPIRLEGAGEGSTVLIKEIQYGLKDQILHVDFFRPRAGTKIRLQVPLVVRGEAELTRRGVTAEHQLQTVECECMASDVPEAVYVDVAACHPGQHLAVGDLAAPPGVRILDDPERVVVAIEAPMSTMLPGEGTVPVTAGE